LDNEVLSELVKRFSVADRKRKQEQPSEACSEKPTDGFQHSLLLFREKSFLFQYCQSCVASESIEYAKRARKDELMTAGKKQQLVEKLQENVSEFFSDFHKKHELNMQCAKGCAQCCNVQLSIFPVEAQRIFDWWQQLEQDDRQGLSQIWKSQSNDVPSSEGKGKKCSFLFNEVCSVYPVRPIICRSQGLPLKMKRAQTDDEDNTTTIELSVCELNFVNDSSLPGQSEWLDLDRLNTLLSIAEQHTPSADISPDIIRLGQQNEGRVPLGQLRDLLLQNMN
jgi:Fe-S-cluster containining protein